MIITDFHTHPFLNDNENVCFYENTITDSEDFRQSMVNWGVTKFCGSVITKVRATDFAQIRKLNDSALALKEKWGDLYEPGIHIHPSFVKESCAELERCRKKGVKMVGELVPYMMGWEMYYTKEMHEIYDCIQSLGYSCVSLHTMNEDGMEAAVKNFPKINFVAAHPNDKPCFLRHLERMQKYPNYYLDLSGTGIFRFGLIKYGIKQVGSERFLFGSDYPICNAYMYIAAVCGERMTTHARENIFYKNAERILGNTE